MPASFVRIVLLFPSQLKPSFNAAPYAASMLFVSKWPPRPASLTHEDAAQLCPADLEDEVTTRAANERDREKDKNNREDEDEEAEVEEDDTINDIIRRFVRHRRVPRAPGTAHPSASQIYAVYRRWHASMPHRRPSAPIRRRDFEWYFLPCRVDNWIKIGFTLPPQ